METLIGLAISGIVFIAFWIMNERHKARTRDEKQTFREYMLKTGIKTTVPYKDIIIKTSFTRREVIPTDQYEGLSAQVSGRGPEYESSVTSHLTYNTLIDGEAETVYSQPFPVDKQYMLFALMGKENIDVYTSPDEIGHVYFDVEIAEQD